VSWIFIERTVSNVSFSERTIVTYYLWYFISVRISFSLFYKSQELIDSWCYLKWLKMTLDRNDFSWVCRWAICRNGLWRRTPTCKDWLELRWCLLNNALVIPAFSYLFFNTCNWRASLIILELLCITPWDDVLTISHSSNKVGGVLRLIKDTIFCLQMRVVVAATIWRYYSLGWSKTCSAL
jgi:hypothetical protein